MAKPTLGKPDVDVDVDVDDYGSIYDEELVVPLTLMVQHPRSHPSKIWKMKKVLCAGIIGMTAAVTSSTVLFYSIMNFSKQARTEPSFLLHASVGADDSKCIPASGPWPTGAVSKKDDDDDDGGSSSSGPYVTCFALNVDQDYDDEYESPAAVAAAEVAAAADHCWSHSHYESGDWKPCKPKGFFGTQGWSFDSPIASNPTGETGFDDQTHEPLYTCGKPCTEFAS